jgi:hypothetical protein
MNTRRRKPQRFFLFFFATILKGIGGFVAKYGGCRNKLEKKGRELWRSSGIGLNFAYRKQN